MKIILTIVALALVASAHAQMRKCVDADGKVTYSDVLCANTTTDTPIRIRDNTLDASAARQEVQNIQSARARDELLRKNSGECAFSYYPSDSRGKALAANARKECVDNKLSGGPKALSEYRMWKEHTDAEVARRRPVEQHWPPPTYRMR